jgi:DnaJ-class molecular chaperone
MSSKKKEICPVCNGSGVRLLPILMVSGLPVKTELICVNCKGIGKVKK